MAKIKGFFGLLVEFVSTIRHAFDYRRQADEFGEELGFLQLDIQQGRLLKTEDEHCWACGAPKVMGAVRCFACGCTFERCPSCGYDLEIRKCPICFELAPRTDWRAMLPPAIDTEVAAAWREEAASRDETVASEEAAAWAERRQELEMVHH